MFTSIDFILLLAVVPLASLAFLARYILNSWLVPGAFFALYWCTAVVLPLLATPKEHSSPRAIIYIFFAVTAFLVGNLLGIQIRQHISQSKREKNRLNKYQKIFIYFAALLSTILGIASVVVALADVGFHIRELFSLSELASIANWYSVGRYQQIYTPSLLSQLLRLFVFLAPLLGGALLVISGYRHSTFVATLTLLPAFLITLIQTERGVTILSIVFFVSSYIAMQLFYGKNSLSKIKIIWLVIGIPVFFVFFTFVAALRAGQVNLEFMFDLVPKIFSNIFGYWPAFSVWVDGTSIIDVSPQGGVYTFAGIADLLGIAPRKLGLFHEFILLESGYLTNIYTVFRALIEDFGFLGSLLGLFVSGVISGRVYVLVKSQELYAVPILVGCYGFTMMSFNTSMWIWNTVLFAYFMYFGIILLVSQFHNRPKKVMAFPILSLKKYQDSSITSR